MGRTRIPFSPEGRARTECRPGQRARNAAVAVALITAAGGVLAAWVSSRGTADAAEAAPAPTVTVTVTVTQEPRVTGRARSSSSSGWEDGPTSTSSAEAVIAPAATSTPAP